MKILLCNNHLRNYNGSELHTLELASFLVEQGHAVSVAAFVLGDPMSSEFARIGIEPVSLSSADLEAEWDLVWTNQITTFASVHTQHRLRARMHIHGLLSSVAPIEALPFPSAAIGGIRQKALTLLANSPLTRRAARAAAPNTPKIRFLWNLAPEPWWGAKTTRRDRLQSVAVVSNHAPPEIAALEGLAARDGIAFRMIGRGGHDYRRITPDALIDFDAVISIGKTVNYCLAAGLPVFIYDHFGGPGWLTEANINRAESRIYSGKCTYNRRSAENIWSELKAGFAPAQAFHLSRQAWAAERYGTGQQMERLGLLDLPARAAPLLKGKATRTMVATHVVGIIRSLLPKDVVLNKTADTLVPGRSEATDDACGRRPPPSAFMRPTATAPRKGVSEETFVFLHLQKCGGTTVHELLQAHYPEDRFAVRDKSGYVDWNDVPNKPGIIVSGHTTAADILRSAAKAQVCTVLREPEDRLLSHIYFLKSYTADHLKRYGREILMRVKEKSISEILDDPEIGAWLGCYYLKQLDPGFRAGSPANTDRALAFLAGCEVVGTFDDLPGFIRRVFSLLKLEPPEAIPIANSRVSLAGRRGFEPVEVKDLTASERARLTAFCAEDRVIFERAADLAAAARPAQAPAA